MPPLPPYLGSAYYPEAWPAAEMDRDIALMVEGGLNVARVAEFAWSTMEPREGEYDFSWLHTAVDKLAVAGLGVIMCTPTCTPPAWLVNAHPEVLFITDDGRPVEHGARRHTCPNNPVYREYARKIVTRLAEEFGRDERIIGWQIDNEVYATGNWPPRSCCCPVCRAKFQATMQAKFGTIAQLNSAWNLALWSQAYSSFEQLPLPRRAIWHHPSLLLAWADFMSDSYSEFIAAQAELLHARVTQPVGTDMMPFSGLDYVDSHRPLDLVQFNHYNMPDNLWKAAFWMDFIRPLKPAPFWNTETQTCWNGSTAITGGTKPEGFCRINSWLPLALGGEANLYWLWRQHRAGQELMHGSVVSAAGRPLQIFGEVQQLGREFKLAGEFLRGTRPTISGLGLMWSQRVARMFQFQATVKPEFNYEQTLGETVYHPLLRAQYRPDILQPGADLSPYRLLLCPLLMTLEERGLRERLEAWVEAGGTLIAGPLTDVRDHEGAHYAHATLGVLENWGGAYCRYSLPGFPLDFASTWQADGRTGAGQIWYDGLEPRGAEALAVYSEGPLKGLASVTRQRKGSGQVILLGTLPSPEDLRLLIETTAAEHGVQPIAAAAPNVLVVPRTGAGGTGGVAMEWDCAPGGWLMLNEPRHDLLSGETLQGRVEFAPYQVRVLVP